jgi:hypothetical protein
MRRLILSFAGAAGLFALAPLAAEETEDAVDLRLGEEVDRICFGRDINGWKTVDKEDDVLLLERGVNNWYRVELLGACDYYVLRRAFSIGLDSRPAGGCVTRGDYIIVEDSPGFPRRCAITRMYEWDDDAPAPGEEPEDDGEEESGD